MKKVCPHCNYPNNEDAFYCSSCQADISHIQPIEGAQTYTYSSNRESKNSSYMSYIADDVSIGGWIGISIGLAIPVVNIIVLIAIIASAKNQTLKNYAIAQVILCGVALVLAFLLAF
ncbi:MAG: zinc ribbon domain-containing protein [Candidatus Niameybacter stercoravium]|nr:zinc ribbon domain-containing protein [Candidatus Niameybacter stercoravium]